MINFFLENAFKSFKMYLNEIYNSDKVVDGLELHIRWEDFQ